MKETLNGGAMTKIKFCGIKRQQDIEVLNEIKPSYAGFVFWQKSKRFVTDEKAQKLKSGLSPDIRSVGVFLDDETDHITALAKNGVIDMIQLHGNEDEEYIRTKNNVPRRTDKNYIMMQVLCVGIGMGIAVIIFTAMGIIDKRRRKK